MCEDLQYRISFYWTMFTMGTKKVKLFVIIHCQILPEDPLYLKYLEKKQAKQSRKKGNVNFVLFMMSNFWQISPDLAVEKKVLACLELTLFPYYFALE